MATRFIDKEYGVDVSTAIANDTTGTRKVQNLPDCTGFVYDKVSNTLKYNKNGTIVEIPDSSAGLTAISGSHLILNTTSDDKQVRINSRSFTQASGSSIGMQSKPSQTVTTTGDVIGAEFSPRYQDAIGGGSLIAVRADPILKGTTGNLTGNVVGVEVNLDLMDPTCSRTISGKVAALRVFPDLGGTVTGKASVIVLATPNNGAWDFLLDVETSGIAVGSAGTYSTADGYFLIRVPAGTMRIPFFAAVD